MKFFLKNILYVAIGILYMSCSSKWGQPAKPIPAVVSGSKPNIVFIIADDLGYGDVGVYGQTKISTPQIDGLAKEGMQFTQFYAGTSVCAPSRSAFMTGLHTGHTPIRGNKEVQPEGQWPLPASAVTTGEILKNAGYSTAVFGKWGLGFVGTTGDPLQQGFDRFLGYNCQRQSHNYYPHHLWDNDTRLPLNNTATLQTQYAADIIQQKALEYISQHAHNPFFICLTYTLPHAGLQLPANDSLFNHYKKIFNEPPQPVSTSWDGVGYQPQAYPRAAYAAMVGRLDRYVGEVLQTLKTLGIDKNTLVIFTSDNGPHREGGNMPEFFNSSGGLRGVKRDLYEGGIRVPFIVRWPGVVKAATTASFIGASWDMLPTFAELAGVQAPKGIDGISMVPVLQSKPGQQEHAYLYWEFHEDGGRQAVRMGPWKGVKNNAKSATAVVELYNLNTDPYEKNNVAATHPDIVQQVNNLFKNARTENSDFPFLN